MRILHITHHGCIRSIKQAICLSDKHDIYYASNRMPEGTEHLKGYSWFVDIKQYLIVLHQYLLHKKHRHQL